ncbi:hypothetical protein EDD15DRAFT_876321 [Pisolithus albus]|nr:hypothetical protein EDD15DRAFT_876321 [Pisolithus albus]
MVAILSGLELLPPKFWGLQVIMGWLIDHVGPVQGATGINPPWSRWRLFVPLGPPSGRYNSFGLKSALLDRSSILGSGGMSDHSIQSQDGGWKHPWRHCRKVMVSRLLNWPESRQRVCVASVSSKGGETTWDFRFVRAASQPCSDVGGQQRNLIVALKAY